MLACIVLFEQFHGHHHSTYLYSALNETYDIEKYTFDNTNKVFPIKIFVEIEDSTLYDAYSVYKLTGGGCYYIFWKMAEKDGKAILFANYTRHFDNDFVSADAFEDIVIGVSTLEDIIKIDPEMEFDTTVSWGPYSSHLLSNEEICIVIYKPEISSNEKTAVWCVNSIGTYKTDDWGCWSKYIRDEDLP